MQDAVVDSAVLCTEKLIGFCAFDMQAEANMHDEFFGHVLAGIRFGGSFQNFLEVTHLAFEVAGTRQQKEVPS